MKQVSRYHPLGHLEKGELTLLGKAYCLTSAQSAPVSVRS
jgi:hypothetical protein